MSYRSSDHTGAEFSGGEVQFAGAKFPSGMVSFDGAKFRGGTVGFGASSSPAVSDSHS
jgi:hypothetical protein